MSLTNQNGRPDQDGHPEGTPSSAPPERDQYSTNCGHGAVPEPNSDGLDGLRALIGRHPERQWSSDRYLKLTVKEMAMLAPSMAPPAEGDPDFDLDVYNRAGRIRAENEARRIVAAENAPRIQRELPEIVRLDEFLAQPDDDAPYLVEGVMPPGNTLIVAQAKAGKSTLVTNLVRCLVDGGQFLGHFRVNETKHQVVVVDNELTPTLARRELRKHGIDNQAAVHHISLRGRAAAFNPLDDTNRDMWAAKWKALGADFVVFDCLRPTLDALGLDEHKDAGTFLVAYDQLLREAGVRDSALVQHAGHSGERARGDSRIGDWGDARWMITRQNEDWASPRFFAAFGRGDIDVPEGRLHFDPETRQLTLRPGERRKKGKAAEQATVPQFELVGDIIDVLVAERAAGNQGPSTAALFTLVRSRRPARDAAIRDATEAACRRGYIQLVSGSRGAIRHVIANPCPACGAPMAIAERHQVRNGCDMATVKEAARRSAQQTYLE